MLLINYNSTSKFSDHLNLHKPLLDMSKGVGAWGGGGA